MTNKIGSGRNGAQRPVGTVDGRRPRAIDPGPVSRIGAHQVMTRAEAKPKPFSSGVPLGNEKAKDVGGGGPGTGRTLYGQGGTQSGPSGHGPANPGPARPKAHDPWRG